MGDTPDQGSPFVDRCAVDQAVSHLFRREAGRMTAILAKAFGPSHLDLAENVVQEALLRATQRWPLDGIPQNPAGWLMRVAKNLATDAMRRDRLFYCEPSVLEEVPQEDEESSEGFEIEVRDDQLRLMFIACHPALSHEMRVALTLKTVCGFGVAEIARAFLAKEDTIAQRLVRAKARIRDAKLPFEMPAPEELPARLDAVLDTVYLLYNEGYSAHAGDRLVREDICLEACRLTEFLCQIDERPEINARIHALAALLLFQSSRLRTRLDAEGDVLLLADQDRSQWDQGMISSALAHLSNAAAGNALTTFHLLAGIAACHATASSFESTDWQRILSYYDELMRVEPTPVVALNRLVALSFVEGPEAALMTAQPLKANPKLTSYYLLPATLADFHRRAGETAAACNAYDHALKLVKTEPERRFLVRRRASLT